MDQSSLPQVCVFCAIAEGRMPAKKVYEDGDSLAFLDINPRSKGMTVVVPRSHYEDIAENPVESLKVFQSAQTISEMIKTALGAKSVQLAIIPSGEVPHFHIRLYPVYGDEKPLAEGLPFKVGDVELNNIAEKIKSVKVDVFAGSKAQERPAEREWGAEDADYIKRQLEST